MAELELTWVSEARDASERYLSFVSWTWLSRGSEAEFAMEGGSNAIYDQRRIQEYLYSHYKCRVRRVLGANMSARVVDLC